MKTSNKILLGVLLATMFILTGLHLALYAKIKSRDFVSSTEIPDKMERYPLPAIKYVTITGQENCYLIRQEENPVLEIYKEGRHRLAYKVTGDTLVITGDSTATTETWEEGARNHALVHLILPATVQVKVAYGTLYLSGAHDSAHAPSYAIELVTKAHLGIMEHYPKTNIFFNHIDLVANTSSVDMEDKAIINGMNVRAVRSMLNYKNATIRNMTMDADQSTTVTLSGNTLKSLNENSKP